MDRMKSMTTESSNVIHRLYAEYCRKFIAIANAYVQDPWLAEDIVSESFLTLWEKEGSELPVEEDRLPGYLLGIVKHKCLDAIRSRIRLENKCRNIHDEVLVQTRIHLLEHDQLTDKVFSNEISDIFRRELQAMPPLMAKVFSASRLGGKTYQEIAVEFGIPVRRVTHEIQKALALLRKSLQDYLP